MKKAVITVLLICLIASNTLAISSVAAAPPEKIAVIVGFKGNPNQDLINAYGGNVKCQYNLIPAIACELTEQAINALKKNPVIAYIEEDIEVQAIADTMPWGVDRIDADVVQAGGNTGTGVKIAIIDTGIDYTHPDLNDNYKGGYDFVNNDADPKDDNGHGTHCAGIAAAESNGLGVIGVAPQASLYAVKVLNSRGSGTLSGIILGIEWSVNYNIQVASMSLGTSTYTQSLKDACDNANVAGLIVVAAAGNEGDGNPDTVEYSYPAAYESVIAVGATDRYNVAPYWSNTGPYVELAAPGVGIYSTLPTYRVTLSRSYGYNYGTLSGTSMACPHVTGTVALVIASDPTLTGTQVRDRLTATADDLGNAGKDNVYGYGLVDADEAAPAGPPDLDPPAQVTGLTITTVSSSRLDLSWNANSESDLNHYNVYRSTASGGTYELVGSPTTNSYSDTGLTASTTYYYKVGAEDNAGNEGLLSEEAAGTTASAPPQPTMHIDSVDVALGLKNAGPNKFYWGIATVTIVDANGAPVAGATVYGHWEGSTTDSDSGTTGTGGTVSLTSDSVRNPATATFTFVVDNVVLNGWIYDSTANAGTSDSVSL
jgi:subtilisin